MQPARKCEAGGRGLPSNVLQSAARDATAALLEGFEVARRLCADQPREPERLVGNRKLLALIVDDLQEQALVRAALVQLAGRVQVARAEPVRDDAARLPPGLLDQRLELRLLPRVDEGLDRDVVALVGLREQLVG